MMSINYDQIHPQIKQAGAVIVKRRAERNRQTTQLRSVFDSLAGRDDLDTRLQDMILQSKERRCAVPLTEPVVSVISVRDSPLPRLRVLACDGSQINPNRHDELTFSLINTTVFSLLTQSSEPPLIFTETNLLDFNEESEDEMNTEDIIALKRDTAEKTHLAKIAVNCTSDTPIIAISDGPLELFNQVQSYSGEKKLLREYEAAMRKLAERDIIAAGYIDRPRANLVVRMIDLLNASFHEDANGRKLKFPLACDADLFSLLLAPGERSAVFEIHSPSNDKAETDMKICCFYLNVGRGGRPMIARVEIPARIASQPSRIDLLHSCLLAQNAMLSTHPYPYVLHRAHECAVVSFIEKDQIKNLLMRELLFRGEIVPEKSNKQFSKDAAKIR